MEGASVGGLVIVLTEGQRERFIAPKARSISVAPSMRSPRTAPRSCAPRAFRGPAGPPGFVPRLGVERRAAEPLAVPTGPLKAGAEPLLDHRPFELGKDAHHAEQRLAGRRGGVDALLVKVQVDLGGVDLAQEPDQVLQAAPKPIDAPGHDDIELPPVGIAVQPIERGALLSALGAADAVIG